MFHSVFIIRCPSCRIEKPIGNFLKIRQTFIGINKSCAECTEKAQILVYKGTSVKEYKAQKAGGKLLKTLCEVCEKSIFNMESHMRSHAHQRNLKKSTLPTQETLSAMILPC